MSAGERLELLAQLRGSLEPSDADRTRNAAALAASVAAVTITVAGPSTGKALGAAAVKGAGAGAASKVLAVAPAAAGLKWLGVVGVAVTLGAASWTATELSASTPTLASAVHVEVRRTAPRVQAPLAVLGVDSADAAGTGASAASDPAPALEPAVAAPDIVTATPPRPAHRAYAVALPATTDPTIAEEFREGGRGKPPQSGASAVSSSPSPAPTADPARVPPSTSEVRAVATTPALRPAESLLEEARLVREMSAALRRNEVATALRIAADHQRRFGAGILGVEVDGMRAVARCRSAAPAGQAAAQASARTFVRLHPEAPIVDRVLHVCGLSR